MKKSLLFTVLAMLATIMLAVPARPRVFQYVQNDGTTLSLRLVGDEFGHFYQNVETGERMQRLSNGDFQVIGENDFEQMTNAMKSRRLKANERRMETRTRSEFGTIDPIIGDKKGLVILVNFQDLAFVKDDLLEKIDALFNENGYSKNGHIGSVNDYFYDQSYGQFNVTFDIVGPVTVSQNMAYYGENDREGNDKRAEKMVIEACQLADSLVDFSQYDWNNDNEVDMVFFIYAGYNEAEGGNADAIWPYESSLDQESGIKLTLDGIKISTYACSSELCGTSGTELCAIGVACHEFCHCLGFLDLYDVDYSGGVGMSYYDIMSSGEWCGPEGYGEIPAGLSAFERWTAGWLTPTELKEDQTVSGLADLGKTPMAYVIYNPKNRNEFIMLENHQSDRWYSYFYYFEAGHGMLAVHIDYDQDHWSYYSAPNDNPKHQRMSWIPADGSFGEYYREEGQWWVTEEECKGDFFGGSGSVTALTPEAYSSVGAKWFTGKDEFFSVTDITEAADGTISFVFESNKQPTDIQTIETMQQKKPLYDIMGRPVDTAYHGFSVSEGSGVQLRK